MQEFNVTLNSVPTHIFCWGQSIHDKFDEAEKQELVLVIPGNPGLVGFYTLFCSTIHAELDKEIPIWVIGHAGHDEPKAELNMTIPPLEGNKDLYNLTGQVKHKLEFIRKYIPKNVKIHLVSHSIGAKISLEILKDELGDQVKQCYMLFPTIEKMVASSNGFWFYKIFDRIFFILQFFYHAFHWLPLTARTILIYIYCLCAGYPEFFLGTILKAATPAVLDKVWFMAKDEMETVREIDAETIKTNLHRLKFYYGTTDGWVPTEYYHELIKRFPGIDAELCTQKINHGFVVSHGPRMGRMVSQWIKRA